MTTTDTNLRETARKAMGPHWRRRVLAALATLADGEPACHRANSGGNYGSKHDAVCAALRNLLGA